MSNYNDELNRAGVLLALDGLQPTAKGARVTFSEGGPTVTDGPFTEAKEMIGGYWLIQAKSKQEAVQWASRCPAADGDVIDVRQVYEMDDVVVSTAAIPSENSPEAVESTASILALKGRDDDDHHRHPRRDRCGLADRVDSADRRAGPLYA